MAAILIRWNTSEVVRIGLENHLPLPSKKAQIHAMPVLAFFHY